MGDALQTLLADIRACRACVEAPRGRALPHAPRPVLRADATARLAVCGQAPGARVHASGKPFADPSGTRLRAWMGVTEEEFYDETRVAIVPMGFCFPGHDAQGGDLPPRKECAALWHARLFRLLPRLELILPVGAHAQAWHLGPRAGRGMTATVRAWRERAEPGPGPRYIPLPHPSWRNNAWIARHPWFEAELLPCLRAVVRRLLDGEVQATTARASPGDTRAGASAAGGLAACARSSSSGRSTLTS